MNGNPHITREGVGSLAKLPSGPGSPLGLAEGTLIGGKYRIERRLGLGAMGVVYAARHSSLDELVAIKFMHPDMQRVPGALERFAREAKACVRIKSEHVANVLDADVSPGLGPYIVMEYLEGEDLGAVSARLGPIPVATACSWVLQACEALALAHALCIVHRDIKPSNLFLTRRGELEVVKLLDFGISKAGITDGSLECDVTLTQAATLLGSPVYMSPEQIRGDRAIDHRSDVWSLGVVLHELLTGRTAFMADSLTQVCAKVLESPTPRLSTANEHRFPRALERVIERCLAKYPEGRYSTVAALAEGLVPFAPRSSRLHADRARAISKGQPAPNLRASGYFRPRLPSPGKNADPPPVQPSTESTMKPDPGPGSEQSWFRPRRHGLWMVGAIVLAAVAFVALADWNGDPMPGAISGANGDPPIVEIHLGPGATTNGAGTSSVPTGMRAANETGIEVRPASQVPATVVARTVQVKRKPRQRSVHEPRAVERPELGRVESHASVPQPTYVEPVVAPSPPVRLLDDDEPVRLLQ